jgi:hypothetical protein
VNPAALRTRAFFDEDLPRLMAARAELFNQQHGVLSVIVEGVGAWTLRFGDHAAEGALTPGAVLDGDLLLGFDAECFVRLLEGDAGVRPVVLGDARLLERLGRLLLPAARGGLGARLWGG